MDGRGAGIIDDDDDSGGAMDDNSDDDVWVCACGRRK